MFVVVVCVITLPVVGRVCVLLEDNNQLKVGVVPLSLSTYNVSIQPVPAREFWPLESRHFVSILRYLIQFLSLWSFVDCGFRVA